MQNYYLKPLLQNLNLFYLPLSLQIRLCMWEKDASVKVADWYLISWKLVVRKIFQVIWLFWKSFRLVINLLTGLIVRVLTSFHVKILQKRSDMPWQMSCTVYNQKYHLLLVGSRRTTIYSLLNTKSSTKFFNIS